MKYDETLIRMTAVLTTSESMYSLICLSASGLSLTLSGVRCYLDGRYLLCLSADDTLQIHSGWFDVLNLQFLPYFYNVNLNHYVIGLPMYEEMRSLYGYPDFTLFRRRDNSYFGILPLHENEYLRTKEHFLRAGRFINNHENDYMWSCRTRSEMISILQIAEGAKTGDDTAAGTGILRYIRENLGDEITLSGLCQHFHTNRTTLTRQVKDLTGMTPMQYVREERLSQSCPDLLFTFLPIGDIAEKYGFSDANYYIRSFKKRYGKSPLQYRTEGFDERIRSEGIYHKKEQELLQISAFERNIRKGLGRAVLQLREEADKSLCRAPLLAFLAENSRVFGIYEKNLIDCFDDREMLAAEAASILLEQIGRGEHLPAIPLLTELGYGNQAREITERLYSEAHGEMLEHLRTGNLTEKYPPCACRYTNAAAAIGRYCRAEPARIKKILLDMADFYTLAEHPPVPEYQNPLFLIMDGIGRETLFSLLDETAAEHPCGDRIHLKHEIHPVIPPEPDPHITAEEILTSEGYENFEKRRCSLHAAPPETVRAAAEGLLAEKNRERQLYLMEYFLPAMDAEAEPPLFPLDPVPLITIAEEERTKTSGKTDIPHSPTTGELYCHFLCHVRHPAVREYGMRLMAECGEDSVFFRYGMQMVWGVNYEPEDKEIFAAFLYRKDSPARTLAFHLFTNLIRNGTPNPPLGMLPFVWEECDWIQRENLAKALSLTGTMPDNIREECRWDFCSRIRKLADEAT